jgi:hypothetical protein
MVAISSVLSSTQVGLHNALQAAGNLAGRAVARFPLIQQNGRLICAVSIVVALAIAAFRYMARQWAAQEKLAQLQNRLAELIEELAVKVVFTCDHIIRNSLLAQAATLMRLALNHPADPRSVRALEQKVVGFEDEARRYYYPIS